MSSKEILVKSQTTNEDTSFISKTRFINFFLKTSSFQFRLLVVILYFFFVMSTEFFYRKSWFESSIDIELNLQKSLDTKIFNLISDLGTLPMFFPILVIFYFTMPLNIPYLLFSVIIHSTYWDNILKIMYGQQRPYWVSADLQPSCNMGFGNPSGHSMSSSAVYLSIWHILCSLKIFKQRIYLKLIAFIFFILLIILVIFSRIVVAAHSINQVLYGGLLGIGVYLIHFYLFELHKISARDFFEVFLSKNRRLQLIGGYVLMLVLALIFYFTISNQEIIEEYKDEISKKCLKIADFKKFNEDGLFNAFSLFALIGAHLSYIFFVEFMERNNLFEKYEEIYHWNNTKFKSIANAFLIFLMCSSPLAFFFVFPGTIGLFWVYLFKIIIPYFVGSFGCFGLTLWLSITNKYCNEKIHKEIRCSLLENL